MCGIISAKNLINDSPVNDVVKFLYFNQKERGHEGYGFIGLNKQQLDTYRSTTEQAFLGLLDKYQYDEVILHHRLPTSTDNTLASTHPFVITYKGERYYFCHNGIVLNDDELQVKHSKLGIRYLSYEKNTRAINDSEALAWEFVLWLHDQQKNIEAYASAAFICLVTNADTNRAQRLYFYCNSGSPLKIYRDKTLLVISSEANWGREVPENQLYYYDYSSKQIVKDKKLVIENSYFSDNWWSKNDDWDLSGIGDDIEELEQRREYLIRTGDFQTAAELDSELEYLWQEYAEVNQALKVEKY